MHNSIFQKPWWLEAVAPGHWHEVTVTKGGKIIASLPYVRQTRRGFSYLIMPPLTQTLGPWLRPSTAKYANVLAEQKDLLTELIQGLPPFDYFEQNFHYSISNWLPFYWQGYQQTTKYTYVLEDIKDEQKVWNGMSPNIKTDIKKAAERFNLQVRTDLGIEDFWEINELSFKRQGKSFPYSYEVVRRLDEACQRHNARKIFFAVDPLERIHAAVYLVWDEQAAYYLMGGSDPALRSSGANSFLIWETIRFAATVTSCFDFEGSMMEPVERFFRAFGARQKPYFRVFKINSPVLKIARDIKSWWQFVKGRQYT